MWLSSRPIEEKIAQEQRKKPLHDNAKAQTEIIKLYKEGVAVRQIGKQFGYAESTIRSFINNKIRAGKLSKN